MNGGSPSASRSLGKDSIEGISGSTLLSQCTQLFKILLGKYFPRGIQNCWRTRASTCSLPTCMCFLWKSWTNNQEKEWVGERIAWCFTSEGIEVFSSRPTTLIIPSKSTGCSGSWELLLDIAGFLWRALYSSWDDLIWAILHSAYEASLRTLAFKSFVCRFGGGINLFALYFKLNLYLIHQA